MSKKSRTMCFFPYCHFLSWFLNSSAVVNSSAQYSHFLIGSCCNIMCYIVMTPNDSTLCLCMKIEVKIKAFCFCNIIFATVIHKWIVSLKAQVTLTRNVHSLGNQLLVRFSCTLSFPSRVVAEKTYRNGIDSLANQNFF